MTVCQIPILYTLYYQVYDTTNLASASGSRDLRLKIKNNLLVFQYLSKQDLKLLVDSESTTWLGK